MTAKKKLKKKVRRQQELMGSKSGAALRELAPTEFSAWLLKQTEREDVVGDLARDASIDGSFPSGSASNVADWLHGRGLPWGARSALVEAIWEWRALRKEGTAAGEARRKQRATVPQPPAKGSRYRLRDGSVVIATGVNVDRRGRLVWVATNTGTLIWASGWPNFVSDSVLEGVSTLAPEGL